jgi:hypothetical protein
MDSVSASDALAARVKEVPPILIEGGTGRLSLIPERLKVETSPP